VPLIIIQIDDGKKYLKPKVKPDEIESWVKDYSVIHLFTLAYFY